MMLRELEEALKANGYEKRESQSICPEYFYEKVIGLQPHDGHEDNWKSLMVRVNVSSMPKPTNIMRTDEIGIMEIGVMVALKEWSEVFPLAKVIHYCSDELTAEDVFSWIKETCANAFSSFTEISEKLASLSIFA